MEELFFYLCEKDVYLAWFVRIFEIYDFTGIDKLFYAYLCFCNKLRVNPRNNLDAYFVTDATRDIKKFNIKLETQASLDYAEPSQLKESVRIISELAKTTISRYTAKPEEEREFKVVAYELINKLKKQKLEEAMLQTFGNITQGEDVTDSSSKLSQDIFEINKRLDPETLTNIEFKSSSQDDDKMIFVAKTGLPCIDGDIGGIYAPLIYTLNSLPGGGKTKLSMAHFAYPVLKTGKDVLYYELELSKGQTENEFLAYHIAQKYAGRVKIPSTELNKLDELSQEQRHIREAAYADLFENEKYGKLSIQRELVAETMDADIRAKLRQSDNVGLIVIDYVGYITSVPQTKYDRRLEKPTIIEMAYEVIRRITHDFHVPAVMINQFNDAGIDAATAGRFIKPGMVQGGHAPGRYTDYDLNLTYTPEQKLANLRTLSTATKTRGSRGFGDQLLDVDLSILAFRQVSNLDIKKE